VDGTLSSALTLTPPWHPTTCACLLEWAKFASPFHPGTTAHAGMSGAGSACFHVEPKDPCLTQGSAESPTSPRIVIKCPQAFLFGAAIASGELRVVVGRCRLTVSKPVLKAPMVSALETTI
jgi:hypothetical protein